MTEAGLTPASAFLVAAARKYFETSYHTADITENDLIAELDWRPSLHLRPHKNSLIIAEASDSVFPMMFHLRRMALESAQVPVSVYCVCPEELYVARQGEVKELIAAGYGLITVDATGTAFVRHTPVPIQQIIAKPLFDDEIADLPKKMKQRLAQSYIKYSQNPPSGVSDITEVMEGLVGSAAKAARKKGWLTAAEEGSPLAIVLSHMSQKPNFNGAKASIGAAQGYVNQWRNPNHHFPKTAKAAAKKYRDCRHGFLEGLKQVSNFRTDMKKCGLNVNLPAH